MEQIRRKIMRKSGVLLPVASLHSKYGIGCFSKEAYEFVDFLKKAGQSYWQLLPLGPTGYGDSPYQSFSTFAGNPYHIDLDGLVKDGYLKKSDLAKIKEESNEKEVDYGYLYHTRYEILKKAFINSKCQEEKEFQDFCMKEAYWLENYALYMAIKDRLGGICWLEWEDDFKKREQKALEQFKQEHSTEIAFYGFQQYLFKKQWKELKDYANKKKIKIIGDIPIYVALDSADAWSHPELFQFDEDYLPTAVAGCPPDAFSDTGQLWGNPLYRWPYHATTGFTWWIKRIAYCYELYDVIRIDHFRGFDEYYAIPYGHPTAEHGEWKQGPGYEFFRRVKSELGEIPVIAEDLGFLTDSVLELVAQTGYPGMKILQFAFDAREPSNYLPHNYSQNSVVYTGTHDNDTTRSWFATIPKSDRQFARKYLGFQGKHEVEWQFIKAALSSVSNTAIIPMQDYLGLGARGRTNTPSTLGTNWKWRMKSGVLTKELAHRIKDMTKLYGRL
ncbi:MAG: 4-alpha-glucanotransferase [Eubacteriales bacterium]